MISFNRAVELTQQVKPRLLAERIPLIRSTGRILAEDLCADSDIPAFNRSAMDGFACRKADLGNVLLETGVIPAGTIASRAVGQNECMRIMTGGMVPEGADFVVRKEDMEELGDHKVRSIVTLGNANIRYMGEDLRKGDLILGAGSHIGPQQVALLASGGLSEPLVYCKPTVAILSTGDELVPPDVIPGPAQIRESNGYQLAAQLSAMQLDPVYLGIAKDDKEGLTDLIARTIEQYDITLLSGGVSVGDFDFVPGILQDLGVTRVFHRILAKPGKHLFFGIREGRYVFGFPGNPVSTFVMFELVVKPFLNRCMGNLQQPAKMMIPLAADFALKNSDLVQFFPVELDDDGQAVAVSYHGSAHLHAYAGAHGIMEIPAGTANLKKGQHVRIHLI